MAPHLIAYLDLDDLLAELVRRDTQAERVHVIHVQPTTTSRSTGYGTMLRTSAITIEEGTPWSDDDYNAAFDTLRQLQQQLEEHDAARGTG